MSEAVLTKKPIWKRWWFWVGGIVAFIIIVTAANGGGSSSGTKKASTASGGTTSSTPSTPSGADTSSKSEPFSPTASMYSVRVKTLSKQCFGSAGCNVSIKVLLTLVDPQALNHAAELSVRITGDESGPTIETIDVDDQGNYAPPTDDISTPSNATVVRAKITEVAAN